MRRCLFLLPQFPQLWVMLKRVSNVAIVIICCLLAVGIIVTRQADTAIEVNVKRQNEQREKTRDYTIDCNTIRNPLVVADTSKWVRLQYTLPSFSSYNVDKKNGAWFIEEKQTNTEATSKYLGKMSNAFWTCEVQHNKPDMLKVPDYVLDIITSDAETLTYSTYVVDTSYLIQDNTGRMYYGNADSLFWQLYFGKHRFIPELSQQ